MFLSLDNKVSINREFTIPHIIDSVSILQIIYEAYDFTDCSSGSVKRPY